MSRKKKHAEHANHERWLVSYADFITLLFAFFVVLYSSSQVDQRKAGKLAVAIQVAFEQLGVFPASSMKLPIDSRDPLPFDTVQTLEKAEHQAAIRIEGESRGVVGRQEGSEMSALQQELEAALKKEIERNEIGLRTGPGGLVISLREVGFFDSGSATLKASSEPALDSIANVLQAKHYFIRIEGHTDNVPIHNSQFGSNWELSTTRATEMVRLLITKYGFGPELLSAAGYAEFHPISTNKTDEGRALNRRVDLVVVGKRRLGEVAAPGPAVDVQTPSAVPSDNPR